MVKWEEVITLALAITMGYAHAIAESVSISHSYSFHGSPEPIVRIRLSWLALSFVCDLNFTFGPGEMDRYPKCITD